MTPLERQKAIRKLAGLPWYARLILYDLAARCNSRDQCFPLQATLAKDNGVSLKTISRAVSHLTGAGLLEVKEGKHQATYMLTLEHPATSHRRTSYVSQTYRSSTTEGKPKAWCPQCGRAGQVIHPDQGCCYRCLGKR